jgi:hypothetical protein
MPIRQVLSNFTFEQQRLMINNIGNDIGDLSGLPPTFSGKTLKDCFGTLYSGNTGINSVLYSPTMFSVAISGGTATNTSMSLSTLSNSQINNPTIENGTYTNAQTYYGRITIASGTPQGGTRVTLDNRGDFFGVSLAVSSGIFNIFTTTSGHPLSLGAFNGPTVILNSPGNLVVSGNTNIVGSLEVNSITVASGTINTPTISGGVINNTTVNNSNITNVTLSGGSLTDLTALNFSVTSGTFNNITSNTPQLNSPVVSSGTFTFSTFTNCSAAGLTSTTSTLLNPFVSSGTLILPTISGGLLGAITVVSGTAFNLAVSSGTISDIDLVNPQILTDATFRGNINLVSGSTSTISFQNGIGEIDIRDIASTPLSFPAAILNATKNVSGYTQINIQNISSGNSSSADLVVTADNGTDSTNYIDLGVNSSTYNQAAFNITGANDGYLYINGGNLALGTASSGKTVVIHVGDTTSAAESIRIRAKGINSTGVNTGTVSIQGGVSISGNTTILGAIHNPTVTSGTINSPIINGPVFNATNVTGTVTLSSNVDYAFLTASSGYTVTLPTPSGILTGKPITLVRTDSTANTIAIAGHINGSASTTNTAVFFASQVNRRFMAVCNGTSWYVTGMTATSGVTTLTTT